MKNKIISVIASLMLVLLPQLVFSEEVDIKDEGKDKKPAESTDDESKGGAAGSDAAASAAGEDTFSIAFDDGGESRLCPSEGIAHIYRDKIYPVLRARARATYNYQRRGGLAVILDTENGREIYVKRDLLETLEQGEK